MRRVALRGPEPPVMSRMVKHMRLSRPLLTLGLVLATATAARAGHQDPVDCAALLLDPELRPIVWENVTAWRAWSVDAARWGLEEANETLAEALGHDDEGNQSGNETGQGPPPRPDADPAGKLDRVLIRTPGHAVDNVPVAWACADESVGLSESLGPLADGVGDIQRTLVTALEPYADFVRESAHDGECAFWHTLGQEPSACAEESP